MAALDLDTTKQPLDHGKLTVVISYRTSYLVNNQDPLFVSFALGNDVSLRYVIELPTLLTLGGLIDSVKGAFVCSEINCTFPLTLDPPGKGLPDRVVFDNSTLTIHVGVLTNVRPVLSFIHYTSAESRALPSPPTNYSEHIIVYDKFFRGNVSRDIEYVPRCSFVREGGVTTKINSIEPPRLNLSELRSLLSVNINNNLCEINIKCSNFVNSFGIISACTFLLQTKYITSTKDKKFSINIR